MKAGRTWHPSSQVRSWRTGAHPPVTSRREDAPESGAEKMIPLIMLVVVLLFTAGLCVCAVVECWDTRAGETDPQPHGARAGKRSRAMPVPWDDDGRRREKAHASER